MEAIVADLRELNELLSKSEPSERRAFVEAFVEQIVIGPGQVKMHYTMPHAGGFTDSRDESRRGGYWIGRLGWLIKKSCNRKEGDGR